MKFCKLKTIIEILIITSVLIILYNVVISYGATYKPGPDEQVSVTTTALPTVWIAVLLIIIFLIDIIFLTLSIKNKRKKQAIIQAIVAIVCLMVVFIIPVTNTRYIGGEYGTRNETGGILTIFQLDK